MSRAKLIIPFLIILVALTSLRLSPYIDLVHEARAATTSFTLYAAYSGWNFSKPSGANPDIIVNKGDTVSFNLIGEDSLPHLFLIDFDGNGVTSDCPGPGPDKCSGNIPAMGTSSVAPFTVTANQGTYSYYCLYHSPAAMVGKFIVQPPGPDFRVSSNPSSLTILQGSKANSTITVTSLNNFAGPVTLSSSPSSPPGLMTSSFSRNPVTVPAGGTANSNFTISVPASASPGSYSLTVTGSNSTTSRTTSVSVTVTAPASPDFTIISSPSSLNIPQGSSGTTTITLTSLNGFSGTVSLTASLSSNGPQVTFSPASVAVPSGGSISSTLSVSAASSGAYSTPVSQGSYTVTVTGTSGSLVHSATLSLTVGSPSGVGGLPSSVIIGGGIAAAVAVVAAIAYALRRRTRTKT